MTRQSRAPWAAVLLVVLLGVLLGAWFVSGWDDVRARQAQTRAAPHDAATRRAAELSRELRGELERVIAREVQRPYFHYQNLMHDPRGSVGSVTPSPLARGPEDPLVRGYFQIEANGRATTPTINDEVPALSEPTRLPEHRAFRDAVVRDLAAHVGQRPSVIVQSPNAAQAQTYDASTYTTNNNAAAVYLDDEPLKTFPDSQQITVIVSALEWRTLRFEGVPALVAVRDVQTPDGTLAQGFVIDRSTLTSRLAGKAGDMVAELHAGGAARSGAGDVAPGWQLTVTPNPRAVSAAATDAIAIARTFVIRFVVIALIAAVLAAFVVVLVVRAEALARERSQFAAAAAHELRTPLAGLQLYGDMVADGLGDPAKLRDYARRMSEEAARLGRVVSNVLGFSQLERGNLSVDAQPGAVGEALCELAERVQPALDRAGAVLDLDVSRELRASFDRDALDRIVGNLLDNAEKYTRGTDDRTIALSARDAGDDIVEIVVADRGPGIADSERAFRPFVRGVPSDGPAGLGLGLALSRSLAEAMGGTLSYRRRDGGGSELVLALRA